MLRSDVVYQQWLCVQGVEESSISIGLDDSVRIDLAVVGCVAVSPKGLFSLSCL